MDLQFPAEPALSPCHAVAGTRAVPGAAAGNCTVAPVGAAACRPRALARACGGAVYNPRVRNPGCPPCAPLPRCGTRSRIDHDPTWPRPRHPTAARLRRQRAMRRAAFRFTPPRPAAPAPV